MRQYFDLFSVLRAARVDRQRSGTLAQAQFDAIRSELEALGVHGLEQTSVGSEAFTILSKHDGFEPFMRWAVEEGHLQLIDECEYHEVREMDGDHFRWAWERLEEQEDEP